MSLFHKISKRSKAKHLRIKYSVLMHNDSRYLCNKYTGIKLNMIQF